MSGASSQRRCPTRGAGALSPRSSGGQRKIGHAPRRRPLAVTAIVAEKLVPTSLSGISSLDKAAPWVAGDAGGAQRDRCASDVGWSHIELSTKAIAEMGRAAEPHRIGNFRDRQVGVSRRRQKVAAPLQAPEPYPFRNRYVHQPEQLMKIAHGNAVLLGDD